MNSPEIAAITPHISCGEYAIIQRLVKDRLLMFPAADSVAKFDLSKKISYEMNVHSTTPGSSPYLAISRARSDEMGPLMPYAIRYLTTYDVEWPESIETEDGLQCTGCSNVFRG